MHTCQVQFVLCLFRPQKMSFSSKTYFTFFYICNWSILIRTHALYEFIYNYYLLTSTKASIRYLTYFAEYARNYFGGRLENEQLF